MSCLIFFLLKNREQYVLFSTYEDKGKIMCRAHNMENPVRMRKDKIRLRKIPLDKIRLLYDPPINLPENGSLERFQSVIDTVNIEQLAILDTDIAPQDGQSGQQQMIEKQHNDLPCEGCEHRKDCHGKWNKDLKKVTKFGRIYYNNFRKLSSESPASRTIPPIV